MIYLKSIFYFIVAGLLEIGGGYLVWMWLRDNKMGSNELQYDLK